MAAPAPRSSSQAGNTSTPLTIRRPAGGVEGDILVATVSTSPGSIVSAPSGWTQLLTLSSDMALYAKTAGGSEPASYSWTRSTSNGRWLGSIVAVPNAVVDVYDSATGAASTTILGPSLTPTGDALLIHTAVARYSTIGVADPAVPSGMTAQETLYEYGESSWYQSLLTVRETVAAGATGTRSFGGSGSSTWKATAVALVSANTAPNAPTLTSPTGGTTVDRTVDLDLEGTFSDPDAGDELSEVTVQYRQVGGASTTLAQSASGSTFTVTIAGGTLTAGNYEWRAKTKDNSGLEGPYSGWSQFTAASPPAAPVITAPTDGGTVDTDPYTVTWTAPNQTAYQVRTVADASGSPNTGTVYQDTGEVTTTSARSAAIDFDVNGRAEHVQVRIKYGGVWSAWDSHPVTVSYTPPATPTLQTWDGGHYVVVDITNPAGSTSTASNDLRRQQSRDLGETWTDEAGTVDAYDTVAVGLAADATYDDLLVGSGIRYRYAAVAVGTNGTRAVGAWTL